MIQEDIDLVAGDFNGASWRRKVGADQHPRPGNFLGKDVLLLGDVGSVTKMTMSTARLNDAIHTV